MDFERNIPPKKAMTIGVEAKLKEVGVAAKCTELGECVFIKKDAIDGKDGIRPRKWTAEQLRAIADYIDADPSCKKLR